NDFLETTAETGIIGGAVYCLIFLAIAWYGIRFCIKEKRNYNIVAYSLIALGGYFIDACLNFPMERTTMQVYFACWLALFVANVSNNIAPLNWRISNRAYKIIAGFLLLLILPASWVAYLSYRSMVVQASCDPYIIPKTPREAAKENIGS